MVKKSLADVLRQEAQQPLDLETEAISEAALEPLELDIAPSETEPNYEEDTDEPSPVNTATPRAKRAPTKAELETTVSELRKALKESHIKENSLQQQVAGLQSDLQEQKILVQKLQISLEQTSQLKEELEQAKKVILQLSEVNSKTTQEVKTPRQEVNAPKKESRSTPQKLGLKRLPQHSIQPDTSTGETFERNVGWFD